MVDWLILCMCSRETSFDSLCCLCLPLSHQIKVFVCVSANLDNLPLGEAKSSFVLFVTFGQWTISGQSCFLMTFSDIVWTIFVGEAFPSGKNRTIFVGEAFPSGKNRTIFVGEAFPSGKNRTIKALCGLGKGQSLTQEFWWRQKW